MRVRKRKLYKVNLITIDIQRKKTNFQEATKLFPEKNKNSGIKSSL